MNKKQKSYTRKMLDEWYRTDPAFKKAIDAYSSKRTDKDFCKKLHISMKTLKTIDHSIKNLKKGKVGSIVDVKKYKKYL